MTKKVSNAALFDEIIKSKEIDNSSPTRRLSWLMFCLSVEVIDRPKWAQYSRGGERGSRRSVLLIQALNDCQRCWSHFKPELSDKPRSYLIQVIKSSFIRIWWEHTREAREAGQAWERGKQVMTLDFFE